jgi:hypothetical protein
VFFVRHADARTMCIGVANAWRLCMFYSIPLTMAADAVLFEFGVCQLAAQIPFEGVSQHEALRTLRYR